ncbi:hypothetical protein K525DRAFT_250911 [Schizophyllum commune Loenen D]|nr:hypothetical protein K525DRAFT_250911 [Schizophyllum commune Loenen D]
MSSAFKSFAVSGVQGAIGEAVLQGLTSTPGVSVLVLTRKTTPRPEWLPKEVAHAGIDYDDVEGTASIFREHQVEVVISLGSGIIQQIPLADAAKAAGVQLFVPSEFGTVSKGFPLSEAPPFLAPKIQVAEHLENIGLPSLRIFTGAFETFTLPLVGYTVNKKINLLKGIKGNTLLSVTHSSDIGGFVAYVVTHYPLSDLANKSLRIEGGHITFRELGALLNAPVVEVDEVPRNHERITTDFLQQLQNFVERGLLNTETKICDGDGAGGANDLWKGHTWKSVKESLNLV